MTLNQKLSEMEEKIDQAASDYEDKHSHPRHWDCCYHSGDTEKHFTEGAKWALELPEINGLLKDYQELQSLYEEEINLASHQRGRKLFINDEKIIQKQRKELLAIHQAGYNALKSIVSDKFGSTQVEKIIRDAEDRCRQALSTWKKFKGEEK